MGICKGTIAEEGLRGRASGLLALALGVALALGFVLGVAPRSALASTDTYTSLIPAGDDAPANRNIIKVWFNDVEWYIIKDESTPAGGGTYTLLTVDNIGFSDFSDIMYNAYSKSTIRKKLDAMTAEGGSFAGVAYAMVETDLEDVGVNGAKLYLLSTDEVQALYDTERKSSSDWWLRSPAPTPDAVLDVWEDGRIDWMGEVATYWHGIRPACKINLEAVVFDPETRTFSPRSGRRLAGDDRYGTMSAILDEGFSASEWAVLASGESYPDALSASGLAGAYDAPVITAAPDALSPEARAQLERLGVKSVLIMGSEAAVSGAVEAELADMGIATSRVAGDDRLATSVAALKRLREADDSSDTVVVATGSGFADALSIGPWCWATRSPLVLAGPDGRLSDEAVSAIASDGGFSRVVVVGGDAAVSGAVAGQLRLEPVRLGGGDRYETSRAVAEWAAANGLGYGNATVAAGRDFPDALAGVALAGRNASVLVVADDPADTTVDLLRSHKSEITRAYVLGGTSAVSGEVLDAIG